MTSFSYFENKINAGLDQDLVALVERDQRRSPFEMVWKMAGTLKKKKKKNLAGDHNQSDQPTYEESVTRRAGGHGEKPSVPDQRQPGCAE